MRINRIIITSLFVTLLATCYVHQRVETLKSGYVLQDNISHLSHLIDRNSKLMYNLSKMESPRYLLTSLNGEEIFFAKNRSIQTDNYRLALRDSNVSASSENVFSKVFDIFTLDAQAETR
ncbi:MAG: hypothetical protein ABH862_04875 [Candidatus Omnitrophota bacterium]